jgi:hypothetical protein
VLLEQGQNAQGSTGNVNVEPAGGVGEQFVAAAWSIVVFFVHVSHRLQACAI